MPSYKWNVEVDEQQHLVEYSISWITAAGEIMLDGETIDWWGLSAAVSEKEFHIGAATAQIRFPGYFARKPELVVDGEIVPLS